MNNERIAADQGGVIRPVRGTRRELAVHVLLLSLILLACLAVVRPEVTWTSDEGAVRRQVEVLLDSGRFESPRPLAEVDVEEVLTPIHGASIDGDAYFPFTKQAVWPVLLVPVRAAFGVGGAVLPAMVGALAAGLAAALFVRRFDDSFAVPILWIVSLATPVAFYAFTVLGHTVAASVAAWMTLIAIRQRPDQKLAVPAVAILAMFGTLVRPEVALYSIALAAAVVSPVGGETKRRLAVGAAAMVGAATGWLCNSVLDAYLGGPTPEEGEAILDIGRLLSGAFSSLVLIDYGTPQLLRVVVPVAGGVILLTVAIRFAPGARLVQTGLAITALSGVVLLVLEGPAMVSGLVAAAPFIVCGLLLLDRYLASDNEVGIVLVASAVFVVLVFLGQEQGGGGAQWGGRYLMPAVPLVGAIAAMSLVRRSRSDVTVRALLIPVLAVVTATLSLSAMWLLRADRADTLVMVQRLDEVATSVAGQEPPMVVSPHTQLGRHAWTLLDEIEFVMIPPDEFDEYLGRVLAVRRAGFAFFGDPELIASSRHGDRVLVESTPWPPHHAVIPLER